MNMIEQQNLSEILDKYINEVIEEHSKITQYCDANCVAFAKKQIAIWAGVVSALGEELEISVGRRRTTDNLMVAS